MAEAPGDQNKGQDANRKSKKKRQQQQPKKSVKEDAQRDGQLQKDTKAGKVPEGKEGAKVGNAERLPKSLPAKDSAEPNNPRTLTKLRPSLLALREAFRKLAPKPKMDMGGRKISVVSSSMASGPSSPASGPSTPAGRSTVVSPIRSHEHSQEGHSIVDIGRNKNGNQSPTSGHVSPSNSTAVRSLPRNFSGNITGGRLLAYCVAALVMLAVAVLLVVIMTMIFKRMPSKKQEVSSSVTTVTSPHQVKGGVGADGYDRTMLPVR